MQIKPLFRDPVTGYIREAQPDDALNIAVQGTYEEYVTLFDDAEVLTCCALVEQTAIPINSVNLPSALLRNVPYVDCIILQAGLRGQTVKAALTHGKKYTSSVSIAYSTSDTLYLGRDGKITTTVPSLLAGDRWLVELGRISNHYDFIFDPKAPFDLENNNGYQGSIPALAGKPNTWLFNDGSNLSWKVLRQSDLAANAAITNFATDQSFYEVGQQVANPHFNANYNDTVVSARLKDNLNNIWQTLSNTGSFYSNNVFSLATPGSILFTLEATLSETSLTSSLSIAWQYRKYYGTSSSLTNIANLQYNNLSSSKAGSFTVNANPGEYIYLAIPASFGTPIFNVGGFEGGFHLDSTINFTNSFNVTVSYNIYKSDNHSLGSTSITVS